MKVHTNERFSQGGGRLRLAQILAIAGAAAGLVAFSSIAAGAAGTEPQNVNEKFADHGPGLPPFDIRTDADGAPVAAVVQAREAWAASPSGRGVTSAEDALKAQFPSLRSYRDPVLGSVKWLGATSDFLTPAQVAAAQASPAQVVKDFMTSHPALFEVGPALLDQSIQVRNFVTPGVNITHLTWQQTIGGVPIENARLNASVTADGRLINIGGTLLPEPVDGFTTTKFSLSEAQAIRAAASACGVTIAADPAPTGETKPDGSKVWTTPEELRQDEPVLTKQVYLAVTRSDIRAAYSVLVPIRGVGHWYEVIVDAETGQMLTRQDNLKWDTTQPVTYRVYTSDSPTPSSPGTQTPSGMQFPFVPRQSVTIQPADIAAIDPNGWIPDGGTSTLGNNVDGYIDAANDNTGSPADRATNAARNFDFALATDANNVPTGAPATYRDAAITQLFYLANNYHDRLWLMGFNEAAGNFQTDNFGRGGSAGDFVHAECQDGSGTNNANFGTTSADGSTGRMQMYIFTGPTPARDGSLDGDVVYHELSHGLSIRLHGPAGGLGSATQSGGMGEGWGDFFGICLNAEPSDNFSLAYNTGAYATRDFAGEGTLNTYYGIRRYPYSIDLTKSPLLYGDINPNIGPRSYPAPRNTVIGNSANEVHNVGEVWCNTLLECRYQMSLTDGFAANGEIMQLVVDGMKMSPGSPSFLNERDAILQADLVRYAGAHQFALLTAFAKRGLGSGAQSPDSGANSVVENFDIPLRVDYSFPSGTPAQLSPTASTSFVVHATPFNVTITPGSGRLLYSVNNGGFESTTLTPLGNDDYTATLPAAACFSNFRYYLSFDTSVGLRTSPTTAPAATYAAQVFTDVSVVATDDMEIDRGWTISAGTPAATTGIWNRVAPSLITTASGLPIQPGADNTPAPGTRCWATDGNAGGLGANDVDNGITILTSPTYNLAAANEPIFEYYRWYADNGNATADDTFLIQASTNNGATWQTAEAITASSNAWVKATWKLRDLGLSPTGQVKIRFSASDNTPAGNVGSVIEAAVDDLTITDRLCASGPTCDPDLNQDGNVDQGDIDYLINVVAGGTNPTSINPDFNNDGNADQGDIDSLLNVVAGGACP